MNLRLNKHTIALSFLLGIVSPALADHGPATSGAGATRSAATLSSGTFRAEFSTDYTEFENLSDARLEARARRAGAFDTLDRSFVSTASITYGVLEDFQVGLTLGYYDAVNAGETEFDPDDDEFEILTFDPNGLTDLWLRGKYRFYRGPIGSLAVSGGVKFPTGRNEVTNSGGEPVEPSATAGSGSYDGSLGAAYSRFLTAHLTLDSSFEYTFRTKANGFQLGDRVDAGVALAYRFTDNVSAFPAVSALLEANVRQLFKNEEGGESDPNTGGTTVFLAPGVRVGAGPNVMFTVSSPLPVFQDLNGEQLKTLYKVLARVTLTL